MLRSPSIHSSVCYEREAILELGGYRELPLSQDYRLWCELSRRGWLGTLPEVLSFVRYHEKRESLSKSRLQRDLALDVLKDHIEAMLGESWTREDLEALWAVGYSKPMEVRAGLKMLDRWERAWRSATDLTEEERDELKQLAAFRRWKLLRTSARRQLAACLWQALRIAVTCPRSMIPSADFCY
jgi:hypothetical protein